MKSNQSRKANSEVGDLMRIGPGAQIDAGGRAGETANLEYIFEMLTALRKIAKDAKEESLVYYIEMAALEAGEICDTLKIHQDAKQGK